MRVLHTADWHLGRLFHHASLIEDQRHVLQQITTYVLEHEVDVLIVAGDIYDRAIPPVAAVQLLNDFIDDLRARSDVVIIMISGNHDNAERLGFGASQLKKAGVHILSDLNRAAEPVQVSKAGVNCAFYGIPYHDPAQINVLAGLQAKDSNSGHTWMVNQIKANLDRECCNILISHCLVLGSAESDSERTLAVGGTDRVDVEPMKEFDYVALGHLHSPQKCTYHHIRYSGSPLKYSFSEHEQGKSICLITLKDNRLQTVSELPLQPRRDVRVMSGLFNELCEKACEDPHREDYLLIKIEDKRAILDAMAELRESYPNVLHIEKTGILGTTELNHPNREKLRRGEFHMFRDFYQQMTGEEMSVSEETLLKETIDALNTEMRSR